MSVIAVCGLPGKGKTLFATNLMLKHYRKENNIFKRTFRRNKCNNNIFSNYPIKLQRKTYSNMISLTDFNYFLRYPMDADVVLDEFQMYFDSLDYKNFPKFVRNNFQLHRHFGLNNIYLISQHPSRIVKQARVLVCEFYEIVKFIRIPILNIGFFRYNIFYNYEDYGKPTKVKKNEVPYRFKKRFMFFRCKRAFKAYDTKYMRGLVSDEPMIEKCTYVAKDMSKEEISRTFGI